MAITEFEPQLESDGPNITLLREFTDNQPTVYHFYIDGEESSVSLRREDCSGEATCFTYRFYFFDWEFASADVKSWPELTVIEASEISDGLDELATIEAEKYFKASTPLLELALGEDFPDAYAVEDVDGNLL
jgi:hypothetical protein